MKKTLVTLAILNFVLLIGNLMLVGCDDSNAGDTITVVETDATPAGDNTDFSATATCAEGTQVAGGACEISGDTESTGENIEQGYLISQSIDTTNNTFTCKWADDINYAEAIAELTFTAQAVCL